MLFRDAVQRQNHQLLRLVFVKWHHHTQHELCLAVRLFQLSLSSSCNPRKANGTSINFTSPINKLGDVTFRYTEVDGVSPNISSDIALAPSEYVVPSSNACLRRECDDSLVHCGNSDVSESASKKDIALKVIGRLSLGCRAADIFIAWHQLSLSSVDRRGKVIAFQAEQSKRLLLESFFRWQKGRLLHHAAINSCVSRVHADVIKCNLMYSLNC